MNNINAIISGIKNTIEYAARLFTYIVTLGYFGFPKAKEAADSQITTIDKPLWQRDIEIIHLTWTTSDIFNHIIKTLDSNDMLSFRVASKFIRNAFIQLSSQYPINAFTQKVNVSLTPKLLISSNEESSSEVAKTVEFAQENSLQFTLKIDNAKDLEDILKLSDSKNLPDDKKLALANIKHLNLRSFNITDDNVARIQSYLNSIAKNDSPLPNLTSLSFGYIYAHLAIPQLSNLKSLSLPYIGPNLTIPNNLLSQLTTFWYERSNSNQQLPKPFKNRSL